MSIRYKIFLTSLVSGAVFTLLGGVILYHFSAYNLKKEVANNLKTAAQNKANWIDAYLAEREKNMRILANTNDAKDAFNKIMVYYSQERFYDLDKSRFKAIYKETDPFFRSYLDIYNYHDILLIAAPYGHVMYTAKRETPLGTNLSSGPYKESALANLWKNVIDKRDVTFEDFNYYKPSKQPAMFIGAPALDKNGAVFAVVVLQISVKDINAMMKDTTGLGQTGDTYLIGQDFLMRSDSRFSKESTILKQKVSTRNIAECFKGRKNIVDEVSTYVNYRGEQVLGTSIYIPAMGWALVAEISEKESLASLNNLLSIFIGVGMIVFLLIYFMSNWLGKKISRPIIKLKKSTEVIMGGNLNYRVGIENNDEIGDLSSAFDNMSSRLKELYDNLEEKVRQRTLELEKANKELDSFVYTASHDLKAPLRGISSFAAFLEEDYSKNLDSQGQDYLNEIKKGANRLNNLIDDLLTLSRISRIKNPYENVPIRALIEEVAERISFDIKEKKVDLIVADNIPVIICDKIKMAEVFLNLINNAIKFSSRQGETNPRIEIGYYKEGQSHCFFVKDNGIGIEKEYHEKIFGLFKKLHKESEYAGTGAGLSIVKQIIEDHGGKIWVKSDLGRGAEFYFTIPDNLKTQ